MPKKVVLVNVNYPHYKIEEKVLAPLDAEVCHVVTNNTKETIEATRMADAVMVRETPIDKEVVEAFQQCKIVARYGVGFDNVDTEAAKKRRIYVTNVTDYGNGTVADHAIALMYAVARRIPQRVEDVRRGVWDIGAKEPIFSMDGKTLGVVGCGKIGQTFIKKCSCLGFAKILGYDPYIKQIDGVKMTDLDTLLAESDMISLHMPLTPETLHIINKKSFGIMKPGAILINSARGKLINQDDLVEALKQNKIFGAGIDVFEQEPPAKDNPLFSLRNAIVTDHTSWYSVESLEKLQYKAAMEVARVLGGCEPESWVNRW